MENSELQKEYNPLFDEENMRAERHIESGDLASAAKILVAVVEKDPDNWRAYNNFGIISWNKKAWEDSYTSFKHACSLKPDYVDALINLFDISLKLRKAEESLPVFKKALDIIPDNEEISIIVEAIESQGDEIYTSERALALGTYNPKIEEAEKLLEDGQLNLAMEKYLKINDEDGPHSDVFCGLGIISYYKKQYKDAFSLFFESIKLNPIKTDVYLNFLDAAKECGNKEEALKIYNHNCTKFPSLKKIEDEFNQLLNS
ncbi:MAG: hypothetical protein PVI26_09765 [Chitinispirillia bacterium]|jgi:tetratricopeptide (TPR) repeat protein